MKEIIKQASGIDISLKTFEAAVGVIGLEQAVKILRTKEFTNNEKGFKAFFEWSQENAPNDVPFWFIMEATGVYYERLAYYLKTKTDNIHIVLPNKSSHYRATLSQKGINDKLDARMLTHFALERQLGPWNLPDEIMQGLKKRTREYEDLVDIATESKNRLHAQKASARPNRTSISRINKLIALIEKQKKEIEKELKDTISKKENMSKKIDKIVGSLKGVGFITLIKVVAETQGFANISSRAQLTSYAGLDVVENQSGNKRGRTKISGKGNSHLRKAMYMPALSVVKWLPEYKVMYKRLCERKPAKKIALTAVMRKLLCLIYTLWKKDEEYIINYQQIN